MPRTFSKVAAGLAAEVILDMLSTRLGVGPLERIAVSSAIQVAELVVEHFVERRKGAGTSRR